MECTYIVLLEDDQHCLTTIKQCARLAVWQRSASSGEIKTAPKSAWQQLAAIPFTLSGCYELAEMRTRIKALEQHLPRGAVIAGTSISGLAYNEFSHMGFCLCELESFSPDILDALAAEVAAKAEPSTQIPTEPVSGDSPGSYKINLMEVQAAHPEVSSKKALRPFLASTPFVELEIICSHMPPWLEGHMKERNLTCSRSRTPEGNLRLRISHALCNQTPNSNTGDRP
ncbi:Fe-only nitrogenase accessory AnfO family protein [Desulfovibrio intestinalis]|uniref:Fe-only nitrogenase accessory protein AnfO n=1 Tax=Desulfovibrio intestinalis TaxID=58621 RepID=A0A7W8C2J5_9BACT|nr:Fe-only nitrogenase accessory AnfO family protein [Desulfovibrio intestinalis]MBB5143024.1 hypothetical protein [Desulfovibrio intestinalis]